LHQRRYLATAVQQRLPPPLHYSVAFVHNTKYINQVYASHFEEVESVSAGNIAAVIGLKDTYSGDTLVAEGSALRKHGGTLIGIETPPAVFSRSVECQSGADQVHRGEWGCEDHMDFAIIVVCNRQAQS